MSNAPAPAQAMVPLADPRGENALLREALIKAATSVIDSGPYILGPAVAGFERALAPALGGAAAVGVGSGTDALVLAMLAAQVLPGDEVIVPSHTAGPSVAAIRMLNAVPVFADVELETGCLDPASVAACMGPKVKAIIAVHLYGHPAEVAELKRIADAHGATLIEDCAQALGAAVDGRPVGSLGHVACFSFYPTKNLGALGDGGAVASLDPALVARAKALRAYGWATKPQFAELPYGRCSRLDELQAALLAVKLEHLDAWNERRRAVAAAYNEAFADLPLSLPVERHGTRHVYHLYVVRSERRDALEAALARRGIGTGRHYPYPCHIQPGLADGARQSVPLATTERLQGEILSLPVFASMTDGQVDRVIDAVRAAVREA